MQRNLCMLHGRYRDSLNLFHNALTAPSRYVHVWPGCSNIFRVASPIESKNSDRRCALFCNVVCFQVVVIEPLGIFSEASVNGLWVLANFKFRELFIADVDHKSLFFVTSSSSILCRAFNIFNITKNTGSGWLWLFLGKIVVDNGNRMAKFPPKQRNRSKGYKKTDRVSTISLFDLTPLYFKRNTDL